MLPQGLPERTLGWEILAWGSQMLAQPDEVSENHKMGDPWVYSDEQATFILWFYAIDEYGKFLYRNAVLERPKGWGKSPLLAAICCTELLGPVVFDGWDANGQPVGKPTGSPLVQIAAISDSQANNTMDLVREMLANGQAMYYYPHLDINLSKVTYPGGKKLEKVTASPRGREGNRATFVVMDESISLDTPVITPDGWKTIGEIAVGDHVIGLDGRPTEVVKTTDIFDDRDCFRVSFPDRTSMVVSAGHLWWAKPNGCKPRVMTTQEIFESKVRCLIPRTPRIELPEQDLPIDPYLLGYWLGDGHSYSGTITVNEQDLENLLVQMESCGFEYSVIEYSDSPGNYRVTPYGLKRHLRSLGLLQNKHIPMVYKRASAAQRLSLLQGLMDSDGSANKTQGTFANVNERLLDDTIEVARTLGYRTTKSGVFAYIQGDKSYFRLQRKIDKIQTTQVPGWQTITVEQTSSVPTKCLGVMSEDRVFMCGTSMKATHNTHL